ncbi:MAG: glycosyltransferase family 9 protein [Elusimicrobia bacterium]|nr:glycosyltransferase family 9 protein [Elusimicrobiota bacterium]
MHGIGASSGASAPAPSAQVRSAAALWLGRVGDLIISTPVLRSLRRAHPGARILLVVGERCADTARLIPFVDEVAVHGGLARPLATARLAASLLGRRWDLLIDLNPSFSRTSAALAFLARATEKLSLRKGRLDAAFTRQVAPAGESEHMLDRYRRLASAFGGVFEDRTELVLRPEHEKAAGWLLMEAGVLPDKRNVLIHPGNFKKYDHRWPEEKFAALTRRLLKEPDVRPVFLAGPGEEARVREILALTGAAVPLVAPGPIGVTAAVLARFDLAVVNCTGTMHLAAAVGTPTFGFYSGYADKVWRPRGPAHTGLVAAAWDSCRSVSVDDAFTALRTVLDGLRPPAA